jgi:hypothetical protein
MANLVSLQYPSLSPFFMSLFQLFLNTKPVWLLLLGLPRSNKTLSMELGGEHKHQESRTKF